MTCLLGNLLSLDIVVHPTVVYTRADFQAPPWFRGMAMDATVIQRLFPPMPGFVRHQRVVFGQMSPADGFSETYAAGVPDCLLRVELTDDLIPDGTKATLGSSKV